jgi:subtilase family serine protease
MRRPMARVNRPLVFASCLATILASSGCGDAGALDGASPLEVGRRAVLHGSAHPLALPSRDRGRLAPDTRLGGLALDLARTPERAAALADLLRRQQDTSSTDYHRWLTPEQYGAAFGASPADVARVTAWLEEQGFTDVRPARGRRTIHFAGSVADVEAAFGAEVRRFSFGGREHFAMGRDPTVPASIGDAVTALRGADDFGPSPLYTLSGEHHVAPADFATIYDVNPLYSSAVDGHGVTLVVVGETMYTHGDVATFRSTMGLPAEDPTDEFVTGSGAMGYSNAGYMGEAELDLEIAGAVAPGAKLVYVYTGGATGFDVRNAVEYAVDNHIGDVVSMSGGYCEAQYSMAGVQALADAGDQANAQGMTLVAGAGDSGAAACDPYEQAPSASRGPAVMLPASLPSFTGVGGTEFAEGAGSYWSTTNGPTLGSALSYIPETAWNDSAAMHQLFAGGGGVSTLFAKPPWQTGLGVPADGHRDVPDVAFNASLNHDGAVVYYTPPAGGNGSGLYWVGGTSAATPAFAGVVALLVQATGGAPLGNVNPMLYAVAAQSPGAFHDVTTGDNIVPCQAASLDCPASGRYGYAAGVGYDLATGLGSLDVAAFVDAWQACVTSHCDGAGSGGGASASASTSSAGGSSGSSISSTSTMSTMSTMSNASVGAGGSSASAGGAATTSSASESAASASSATTASGAGGADEDAAGGAGGASSRANASSDGGCGCRASGEPVDRGAGAFFALVALALRRRARRVRPRRSAQGLP